MATKKKKVVPKKAHKTKLAKAQAKRYKAIVKKARPTHRKILLHPATIMVLICLGVLIVNFTRSSNADDLDVSATVPATSLNAGANIDSPLDGDVITTTPTTVSGSCPNNSYVNLYDNGVFSGSAACYNDNFSIVTSLYSGANNLEAKDFNITNQPGPNTPVVSVTYTPPASAIVPPDEVSSLQTSATDTGTVETGTNEDTGAPVSDTGPPPLLLSANYTFKTFLVSSSFKWQIDLAGGKPPYVVNIDWGDGTSSTYLFKVDPLFTITHNYASEGYYPIVVHAVDTTGHQQYIQIAALIHTTQSVGFSGITNKTHIPPTHRSSSSSGPSVINTIHNYIWLLWSTYAFVLLLAFSFWLGERQEYLAISKRRRPAARHR